MVRCLGCGEQVEHDVPAVILMTATPKLWRALRHRAEILRFASYWHWPCVPLEVRQYAPVVFPSGVGE